MQNNDNIYIKCNMQTRALIQFAVWLFSTEPDDYLTRAAALLDWWLYKLDRPKTEA